MVNGKMEGKSRIVLFVFTVQKSSSFLSLLTGHFYIDLVYRKNVKKAVMEILMLKFAR